MVEQITVLAHTERAMVEPEQLKLLYAQLGEAGAEDIVCRAMEELALRLSHTERLYREGDFVAVRKNARSLVSIADQIGMQGAAKVASDVCACIDVMDHAGLGATLARLVRIGEQSLTAIWDLQEFSI